MVPPAEPRIDVTSVPPVEVVVPVPAPRMVPSALVPVVPQAVRPRQAVKMAVAMMLFLIFV